MKKFFFRILVIICGMSFLFPQAASASDHEKTLGLGGGFATHNHAGFGKLFFQYSFVPLVRISPEIGYVFRHDNTTGFEASLDCHFPFRVAKGFKFYPLAGFTFNAWSTEEENHQMRGGFDIGGGFDIYLTKSLKLSLQGKYSAMKETGGGFFDLGIGYVF